MWQTLFASLADKNFMIVAVAEEGLGADAARPWIEQAAPTYWSLIDREHRLAALYSMVNVPQCVWIDESGRIVRGPETTGSSDHFRKMDLATRTLAPELMEARLTARSRYMDAIRDWVLTGNHALPADKARAALPKITPDIARAHAHFRLGNELVRKGEIGEGTEHLKEASRLHPDSWNMWRQTAEFASVGSASGPAFWQRVNALGDRPYYIQPDLPA